MTGTRVVIESPYAATGLYSIAQHVAYARAAVRDSLSRGEAPIASHLLYTQPGVLRDEVPGERAMGMHAGWSWMPVADAIVVYQDLGISKGMENGIAQAERAGKPVLYRMLGNAAVEAILKEVRA